MELLPGRAGRPTLGRRALHHKRLDLWSVSWWLSPAHSAKTATPSVPITVAVVILGFIKCRLIIRYFMKVRSAPRWLRLATDGWLVVLWLGALGIYLY